MTDSAQTYLQSDLDALERLPISDTMQALVDELRAARRVVEGLQQYRVAIDRTSGSTDWKALMGALAGYEASMK